MLSAVVRTPGRKRRRSVLQMPEPYRSGRPRNPREPPKSYWPLEHHWFPAIQRAGFLTSPPTVQDLFSLPCRVLPRQNGDLKRRWKITPNCPPVKSRQQTFHGMANGGAVLF